MKDKRAILNAVPKAFIVIGALLFIFGWVTWENLAWRGAYRSIKPGMPISEVQSKYRELKPSPISSEYSKGGFWQHEAYAHLVVVGPNRWKYVFYLNPRGAVIGKSKWWG